MDAELKRKWVEALRSGKYEQTVGHLRDDCGFCCLGVLADVLGTEWERDEREPVYLPGSDLRSSDYAVLECHLSDEAYERLGLAPSDVDFGETSAHRTGANERRRQVFRADCRLHREAIMSGSSDGERPLVDPESFALARYFLRDDDLLSEDNVWNLAAAIQTAAEDWFDSQDRAANVTAMGADDD